MFLQYSAENENIVNRMMLFVLLLVLLLGSICILIAVKVSGGANQSTDKCDEEAGKG